MQKILVVDDDEATRRPMLRLLGAEGFEAIGAGNAFEALAASNGTTLDLILLDIMIPPMDGLTFLMRLREEPRTRDVPVIVVSGLSDPQTIARAKELGVREHMVKTQFTPQQLIETIRRNLTATPV